MSKEGSNKGKISTLSAAKKNFKPASTLEASRKLFNRSLSKKIEEMEQNKKASAGIKNPLVEEKSEFRTSDKIANTKNSLAQKKEGFIEQRNAQTLTKNNQTKDKKQKWLKRVNTTRTGRSLHRKLPALPQHGIKEEEIADLWIQQPKMVPLLKDDPQSLLWAVITAFLSPVLYDSDNSHLLERCKRLFGDYRFLDLPLIKTELEYLNKAISITDYQKEVPVLFARMVQLMERISQWEQSHFKSCSPAEKENTFKLYCRGNEIASFDDYSGFLAVGALPYGELELKAVANIIHTAIHYDYNPVTDATLTMCADDFDEANFIVIHRIRHKDGYYYTSNQYAVSGQEAAAPKQKAEVDEAKAQASSSQMPTTVMGTSSATATTKTPSATAATATAISTPVIVTPQQQTSAPSPQTSAKTPAEKQFDSFLWSCVFAFLYPSSRNDQEFRKKYYLLNPTAKNLPLDSLLINAQETFKKYGATHTSTTTTPALATENIEITYPHILPLIELLKESALNGLARNNAHSWRRARTRIADILQATIMVQTVQGDPDIISPMGKTTHTIGLCCNSNGYYTYHAETLSPKTNPAAQEEVKKEEKSEERPAPAATLATSAKAATAPNSTTATKPKPTANGNDNLSSFLDALLDGIELLYTYSESDSGYQFAVTSFNILMAYGCANSKNERTTKLASLDWKRCSSSQQRKLDFSRLLKASFLNDNNQDGSLSNYALKKLADLLGLCIIISPENGNEELIESHNADVKGSITFRRSETGKFRHSETTLIPVSQTKTSPNNSVTPKQKQLKVLRKDNNSLLWSIIIPFVSSASEYDEALLQTCNRLTGEDFSTSNLPKIKDELRLFESRAPTNYEKETPILLAVMNKFKARILAWPKDNLDSLKKKEYFSKIRKKHQVDNLESYEDNLKDSALPCGEFLLKAAADIIGTPICLFAEYADETPEIITPKKESRASFFLTIYKTPDKDCDYYTYGERIRDNQLSPLPQKAATTARDPEEKKHEKPSGPTHQKSYAPKQDRIEVLKDNDSLLWSTMISFLLHGGKCNVQHSVFTVLNKGIYKDKLGIYEQQGIQGDLNSFQKKIPLSYEELSSLSALIEKFKNHILDWIEKHYSSLGANEKAILLSSQDHLSSTRKQEIKDILEALPVDEKEMTRMLLVVGGGDYTGVRQRGLMPAGKPEMQAISELMGVAIYFYPISGAPCTYIPPNASEAITCVNIYEGPNANQFSCSPWAPRPQANQTKQTTALVSPFKGYVVIELPEDVNSFLWSSLLAYLCHFFPKKEFSAACAFLYSRLASNDEADKAVPQNVATNIGRDLQNYLNANPLQQKTALGNCYTLTQLFNRLKEHFINYLDIFLSAEEKETMGKMTHQGSFPAWMEYIKKHDATRVPHPATRILAMILDINIDLHLETGVREIRVKQGGAENILRLCCNSANWSYSYAVTNEFARTHKMLPNESQPQVRAPVIKSLEEKSFEKPHDDTYKSSAAPLWEQVTWLIPNWKTVEKISVPGNNSLLWSIAVAFLLPIAKDKKLLLKRCTLLFGELSPTEKETKETLYAIRTELDLFYKRRAEIAAYKGEFPTEKEFPTLSKYIENLSENNMFTRNILRDFANSDEEEKKRIIKRVADAGFGNLDFEACVQLIREGTVPYKQLDIEILHKQQELKVCIHFWNNNCVPEIIAPPPDPKNKTETDADSIIVVYELGEDQYACEMPHIQQAHDFSGDVQIIFPTAIVNLVSQYLEVPYLLDKKEEEHYNSVFGPLGLEAQGTSNLIDGVMLVHHYWMSCFFQLSTLTKEDVVNLGKNKALAGQKAQKMLLTSLFFMEEAHFGNKKWEKISLFQHALCSGNYFAFLLCKELLFDSIQHVVDSVVTPTFNAYSDTSKLLMTLSLHLEREKPQLALEAYNSGYRNRDTYSNTAELTPEKEHTAATEYVRMHSVLSEIKSQINEVYDPGMKEKTKNGTVPRKPFDNLNALTKAYREHFELINKGLDLRLLKYHWITVVGNAQRGLGSYYLESIFFYDIARLNAPPFLLKDGTILNVDKQCPLGFSCALYQPNQKHAAEPAYETPKEFFSMRKQSAFLLALEKKINTFTTRQADGYQSMRFFCERQTAPGSVSALAVAAKYSEGVIKSFKP